MRVTGTLRGVVLLCVCACAAPVGVEAGDQPPATSADRLGLVVCADDDTVVGIDVSYWQGTIDWAEVAADGVDFAFIRVSDGTGFLDPDFDYNWEGAAGVGIVRGAYQFFRPDQGGVEQAELLLDVMGPLGADDLPPVIDVEATEGFSPSEIADEIGLWIDTVEAAIGRAPIIYTSPYFWNNSVESDDFADYPLWIANWEVSCPNLPDPWSDWAFWQDSDDGSVSGISGVVDTDYFNGSLADLLAFAGVTVECGDGTCSPGESVDSCLADCPPCGVVLAEGGIIDDTDACFRAGGPAEYIHAEAEGWEGSLAWTNTTDYDYEVNFGEWTLFFAEAGRYLVEVYTDASFAQSQTADYRVAHGAAADTVTTVTIDQTAVDGWQSLGEVEFAANGAQSIHVGDNTGEPLSDDVQLVFDAVRLTRLDLPPDADAGASATDGGAASDGGAGADAMLGGHDGASDDDGFAGASGCGCALGARPLRSERRP